MIKIGNALIADTVKFEIADSATCIIDDDVEIRDYVVIESGDNGYIHIGKGSVINSGCWFNASGKVDIGEDVLIAPNVSITSSSHRYDLKYKIKDQGMKISEVTIGNDVWIGAGATVLPGVNIAGGSVIAANSMVKFNVKSQVVVAGNPAKKVADRKYKTVVFYTLPMVIRDKPTLFSSIVDIYMPLAKAFDAMGWRCIFVGSNEIAEEYDSFEWVSPKTFNIDYPDWKNNDWMEPWENTLTGKSISYHDQFIDNILTEYTPSLIFCWNFDGILKQKSIEHNIPILFNELGLLRAPNPMVYYSDPVGVNTTSGLQKEFKHYLSSIDSPASPSSNKLSNIEENYAENTTIEDPYVLVLLQVQDDSNIIMGSPFASMKDYVSCVKHALGSSSYKIIVKPHPLDEAPELPDSIGVADKSADTSLLISQSSAVFTINSSAGFEAALAGKTVYVLGDAPYKGLGITIDIEKPETLAEFWLQNTVTSPCSRELRIHVLDFTYDKYFLTPEKFVDPSFHFARLIGVDDGNKERKSFVDECEINRQQAFISYLEKNNKALLESHKVIKLELEKAKEWNNKLQRESDLLKVSSVETEHLLYLTRQSFSWRITRPLRAVRMASSNPKCFLRKIYHKFPLLSRVVSRVRFIKFSIKKFSQSILDAKDNISAIQNLSNRRNIEFIAPKSEELPIIALSIVTFNSAKWVKQFFDSLLTQSYPLNKINLVLVDNGSIDDTVYLLEEYKCNKGNLFSGFEVIAGSNIGFGAGHDTAINKSKEEFILISNIDLTFTKGALKTVVLEAQLDRLNEVASWELRQAPYEHPKYYDPVTLETNWSSHACILIRRTAYVKVKGYDHNIFMYGEDVELSYRFRSFGYHLRYCPSALVFHYTYEHESQVKPLQYKGSTLANFNIRLRYGEIWDKFAIAILHLGLLVRKPPYTAARKDIIKNIFTFIKGAPHFSKGRGNENNVYFPLRVFDYEMIREGAFWEIGAELKENPLVSVIVRTYQGRAIFLRQALQSISNQTYSNIEIIVVEDGGNTHNNLVNNFEAKNGIKIKYYNLGKVGRAVTGNYGLSQASGNYCVFLDDDDLLFSDHVEVLVGALIKDKNAVAAYSLAMEVGTRMVGDTGKYQEEFFNTPECFKQEFDYSILEDHNFIPIQSILFQRSLYLERGGFEEDMDNLEDWNLWLRYGYNNAFIYVPKTTSLFRTPADISIRESRHGQLHQAYNLAKGRAKDSCKEYS